MGALADESREEGNQKSLYLALFLWFLHQREGTAFVDASTLHIYNLVRWAALFPI